MKNISVVIATLGLSESLSDIVLQLNENSLRPVEIIICIPEEFQHNLKNVTFPSNVVVLSTKGKGQVYQRSEGFKIAIGELVLQIDDDCLIENNLLEILSNQITSRNYPTAFGCSLININTGRSFYYRKGGLVESLFRWIINGSDKILPGSVTKAGINFGVDFDAIPEHDIYEVEWIPGGCMMIAKENLVTEDFFPFKGKAYCEDIIHSFLLKKKGVRLFITNNTICKTSIDLTTNLTLQQQLKSFKQESKVRFYYAELTGRSIFRLRMFMLFSFCKILYRRILKLS